MGMTGIQERLPWVRWGFMATHAALLTILTLTTALLTLDTLLIVVHCASAIAMLVYLPAATILAWKKSDSKYDHAGGEVAYLSVQGLLWSGITGGPGICHTALYDSGRLSSSFPSHLDEINGIIKTCKMLSITTAFSVIHVVVLAAWIGLDVWVVLRTSSSSSRGLSRKEAFKLPIWKLVRGEYSQVGGSGPRAAAGAGEAVELGGSHYSLGYNPSTPVRAQSKSQSGLDRYAAKNNRDDDATLGYSYEQGGLPTPRQNGEAAESRQGVKSIYAYSNGGNNGGFNPFESTYDVDLHGVDGEKREQDEDAFENPFEGGHARGGDGGYRSKY